MTRKTGNPAANPSPKAATPLPDSMATGKASPAKAAVGGQPGVKWCQGQFGARGGRPGGRAVANRPVRASTHARNRSVPNARCCCR